MNYRRLPLRHSISALIVAIALAACGGSDDPPPPTEGSATLSAAGGIVTGPDGVQLALPADALANPVTFRIARDGSGAPPLEGINAASPVYAVTPHGQAFEAGSSFSIPLSAAQVPSGAEPMLLKAEPGGKWRVMGNTSTDPARLAADIHDLSYFVIGFCSSTPNDGWTVGGVDCPAAHRLELSLWDGNNERIMRGNNRIPVPWMTITDTPRTLHLRLDWLRPAGIVRTDQLGVVGLPGGFRPGFSSTWPRPAVLDVPDSHSRDFSVVIDPAQVAGASGPNGRVLRIKAYASYTTTAFRIGVGNVPVGFEFETTDIPILVRYSGAQPTISQQPANLGVTEGQPANFAVQASITPTAALTYQWSRRANASAAFAPIIGATAASYNLAATALSDHGAEFQVQVCAGPTRCVPSNVATLSVSAVTIAPAFTTSPVDQMVVAGQTASLNAVATGSPLPQIRWQRAPAGSNSFADVTGVPACGTTHPTSGAANVAASCTVGPLTVGDSGQRYRAVATSTAAPGGVTSSFATVTVNAAPVAPAITQQPAPQTTTVGGSASFSVTASGTAPLSYTWQQNGNNLPSLSGGFNAGGCSGTVTYSNSGSTITLSGLSAGCNGVQVGVTVNNGVNPSAVSNAVVLTVTLAARPTITAAPQSQSVDIGQPATFTVDASGANLTYQWQRTRLLSLPDHYGLFEDIPGATGATYVTAPVTIADDQTLYVVRVCIGPAIPGNFPNCWFLGIIVGAFDEVRLTVNPIVSQNFAFVPSGSTAQLNAVAFANASIGVAVGEGGTLLRTTDGGLSWAPVASGTTLNLGAVALAGNGTGMAVGGDLLLRTTDHGATWSATHLASGGLCCVDVAFADSSTVLVARGTGDFFGWGFLRSTDSGQSFVRTGTSIDSAWYVRFGSAAVGVALARSRIHYTVDGGVNWTEASMPPAMGAEELAYASNSVAIASDGRGGRLMRSSNGGRNWSALYDGGITRPSNALAFNGAGIGLSVGEGPSYGLMRTPDHGQTWVPLALPGLTGSMSGLAFADANVAVAVGPGGAILRFTASGL